MSVRIFKLLSGELVVGTLTKAFNNGPESPILNLHVVPLLETDLFFIENPFLLHYTQQGPSLAPLMPWCNPKHSPVAEFNPASVMCEVSDVESLGSPHLDFVKSYKQIVSPIQLVS